MKKKRSLANILCDQHVYKNGMTKIALRYCKFKDSQFENIQELGFDELQEKSRRLAFALRHAGISKGMTVGVMLPPGPEVFVSAVALARIGAIYQPLFTAFGPDAINVRAKSGNTKAFITSHTHIDKFTALNAPVPVFHDGASQPHLDLHMCQTQAEQLSWSDHFDDWKNDDYYGLIFTSGTTGQPKGVPLPVRSLESFDVYLKLALGVSPDDRYWNIADPGWAYGFYYNVYGPLLQGITAHSLLSSKFSPEVTLQFLRRLQITNFAASPTVYRSLKASAAPIDKTHFSLRRASAAGEPLAPSIAEWFQKTFGAPLLDHYGQSENGMMVVNHHAHDADYSKTGTMGIGMPGFHPVLIDDAGNEIKEDNVPGSLCMHIDKSPLFWFPGYWGRDKDVRVSSYYHTGDRAHSRHNGKVFVFEGRNDDIISCAGYRVGPSEVENSIMLLNFVTEVGVIGVPDERKGEAIKAFVVLNHEIRTKQYGDMSDETLKHEIKTHVRSRLSKHLVPTHVEFVATLPKTVSGKIQRFMLRQI